MTAQSIPQATSVRTIHHNDCFWCQAHREVPLEIKKGKVVRVREICNLDQHPIPAPYTATRWCEHYRQKNCLCNECTILETEA